MRIKGRMFWESTLRTIKCWAPVQGSFYLNSFLVSFRCEPKGEYTPQAWAAFTWKLSCGAVSVWGLSVFHFRQGNSLAPVIWVGLGQLCCQGNPEEGGPDIPHSDKAETYPPGRRQAM